MAASWRCGPCNCIRRSFAARSASTRRPIPPGGSARRRARGCGVFPISNWRCAGLSSTAITRQLETLVNPVFIIQDADKRDLWEAQGRRLRDALARRGARSEYLEVNNDFTRGEAEARAQVFARIGGFLNENIYDFGVNVGESKEVR